MHVATLRLATCIFFFSELWLAGSSPSQTEPVSEIRRHRQVRQAHHPRQRRQSDEETKCRYRVALLHFPPYIMNESLEQGFMNPTISWYMDMACFAREASDPIACRMEPVFVRSQDEMVKMIKNKSVDFAFPLQTDARNDFGSEPVTTTRAFVSSGVSLIVNIKHCQKESTEHLLISISSRWPILVFMMLLSGISGVLIWLLEGRAKSSQFSPTFTAGAPQGFWWAVLSLTTVGYGDITPKTFLGRLIGILWVLVGAIVMSLFTGLIISAMQTAFDGSKCADIGGKEVGILAPLLTTQELAEEFDANVIKFENLDEMQKDLSQGTIGRVLVDRNTAFYFLDKSGLKRNRQIRMIRNIDYPMEYYLAHVSHEVMPSSSGSANDTDESEDEVFERKSELSTCGERLKKYSQDLVSIAKDTAKEQLIPAELQIKTLFDGVDEIFSSDSKIAVWILIYLLAIFLGLVFIGNSCQVYNKPCYHCVRLKAEDYRNQKGVSAYPLERRAEEMMQQYLGDLEERLKDSITEEIRGMKEDIIGTIPSQKITTV